MKLFDYNKKTVLYYVQGKNFEKDKSLSLPSYTYILSSRTSLTLLKAQGNPLTQ